MISVIIPSKMLSNLLPCIEAIRACGCNAPVIVVWDGDLDPSELVKKLCHLGHIEIEPGMKPFIFARNVNIGFAARPQESDFIVLNDDAVLQTAGGFDVLEQAAREHPEFGVIAAVTNSVGNPAQIPRGIGLREESRMVCFVAVYIPRATIEKVGILDERFVGYGLDDDDFCLRIRNAGLKIGIHDGCFVDHASLKSAYRGEPTTPADFRPNLELFKQKWGMDNFGRAA